jgi:hypothetical protein
LYLAGGDLALISSSFAANSAVGGAGGTAGIGGGGGIGGDGGAGGNGQPAGFSIIGPLGTRNSAPGGPGGNGGDGGNGGAGAAGGIGGAGGLCVGGGLYVASGSVTLSVSNLNFNSVQGGQGGVGGIAGSGANGGAGGAGGAGGSGASTGFGTPSGGFTIVIEPPGANGVDGAPGSNGNGATGGAGGNGGSGSGGGLFISGGSVTLINDTLSGHSASGGDGGESAGGAAGLAGTADAGGLKVNGGSLTLLNVTVAGNNVASGGTGGALDVTGGTVTLDNTLVALNTNGTGAGATPDDIGGTVDPSSAFNLIGTGGSGGLTGGVNGNQVGVANPVLGTLASNGGPTQTIALLPGSPAIGAGSDTIPGVTVPTTDQRGVARPSNSIDIGAFQDRGFTLTIVAGSSPQYTPVNTAFPKPLAVIVTSPFGDPVAGGVISFAVTAASNGAAATLGASDATISAGGQASVTAIANGIAGGYRVTASAAGVRAPARFTLKNIAARGGSGGSRQADATSTIALGLGLPSPDSATPTPWPSVRRAPLTRGFVKTARALAVYSPAKAGYAPVANEARSGLAPTFTLATLERQLPPQSRAEVGMSSRGHPSS